MCNILYGGNPFLSYANFFDTYGIAHTLKMATITVLIISSGSIYPPLYKIE